MQFLLARSLWTYSFSARYSIPRLIWSPKLINCLVLNDWCLLGVDRALRRNWFKSPCFMTGNTIRGGADDCITTPNSSNTFSCLKFFITNASPTKEEILSKSVEGIITFTATDINLLGSVGTSPLAFPRWTRPKAPFPNGWVSTMTWLWVRIQLQNCSLQYSFKTLNKSSVFRAPTIWKQSNWYQWFCKKSLSA